MLRAITSDRNLPQPLYLDGFRISLLDGFKICVLGQADADLLQIHNMCNLPVQVLEDVDDNVYPPQQKAFAMLRWMGLHMGSR